MTFYKSNGDRVPDHIRQMAEERQGGQDGSPRISRDGQRLRRLDGDGLRHARARRADPGGRPGDPRRAASSRSPCRSRIRRIRAPPTGRKSPTPSARSSSRWSNTRATSPSSPTCSKAGKSTTTPPNTRSRSARASPGTMATTFNADDVDLQFHPLGRQERRRQFDAGPPRHARRRGDRQAARGRRHQGRRLHGQDQADRSRTSRLIPSLCDYPGADRAPQPSTRPARISSRIPIGTGPFELVSYDVGQKVVYKRRENGAWWGGEAHARRRRVHRLRHRSVGDGHRVRGRRGPHQPRDDGRLRVDPRRRRPGHVGSRDRRDDRGAHQRHQQAL